MTTYVTQDNLYDNSSSSYSSPKRKLGFRCCFSDPPCPGCMGGK